MIFGSLRQFLFGSLRRQLIVGMVLANTVIMSLFVWYLTTRQHQLLLERESEFASALAQNMATSSAVWLAARDYHGANEIVENQKRYPELLYAMIFDMDGHILAHSDRERVNQYVRDLPPATVGLDRPIFQISPQLIDVTVPVTLADRQIGWSRVGLGQHSIGTRMAALTRDGVLLALAAILLAALLATYVSIRLTRRLAIIQGVADAVQRGDLQQRATLPGEDEAGKLAQALNVMLDTLAQREFALRESESRQRTLLQTLPDLIWLKDTQGVYLSCNNRFERFFGAREADIVGKTDFDFVPAELATAFRENDQKALEADGPRTNEEWVTFADDGHRELLETIKTPVRTSDGRLVGVLGIGRDITERKRNQEELERHRLHLEEQVEQRTLQLAHARDAAEAANRAKSIFLSNMSHELRTPLNAILGFAQIMERDGRIPGDQRKNLATINRSGQHLLTLINDVLEISRIEAGRLKVNYESCDLHDLLQSLTEVMALRARDKGLTLQLEMADDLPMYIETDVGKLRQIILNLLSNAVKYTEQGLITLRTRRAGTAEAPLLHFEVSDSGVGIDAVNLEKIFQPFFQTDYGVRLGEGTGLGLAICREYARLLDASLTARSSPGEGSTFSFELPLKLAVATPVAASDRKRVNHLVAGQETVRILVAEDHPDNQRLIAELHRLVGFEVQIASNGEEAVALFQSWHPHFVWMDMRMPVMDGYAATQAIRALPDGKTVPIVALTASAFEEDRARILAAGCNDMLKKPIEESQLFEMLQRHLGVTYEYAETIPPASTSATVDLSLLPEEMRSELGTAAELLDLDAARDIIARIRPIDMAVADKLETLLSEYRFDEIATLCTERA